MILRDLSTTNLLMSTSCAGCNEPGDVLCRRCRFALAATSAVVAGDVRAAMAFEGVGRQALLGLKFGNRRGAARHLARLMVARLRPSDVDIVTWAPTSRARAGRRGFDQAEVLARAVARELGVPCRRLLFRAHGGSQTGHSRVERLRGPAFRGRVLRAGMHVLVVDDVVTTGATLRAARRSLLDAGVSAVTCIAAAATDAGRARHVRLASEEMRMAG